MAVIQGRYAGQAKVHVRVRVRSGMEDRPNLLTVKRPFQLAPGTVFREPPHCFVVIWVVKTTLTMPGQTSEWWEHGVRAASEGEEATLDVMEG